MKTKFNTIKVTIIVLLITISSVSILAQQEDQTTATTTTPSAFLGAGLGINDYGLGMCLEVPVIEKLSIYGNAGLGGWGYKIGAGISFYPSGVPYKSSISLGYASASGLKDFETELEVNPNNTTRDVTLDLNQVGTLNLIYSYNYHLGKKGKFVFSAGYAIAMTNDAYELKTGGVTLSDKSKQVIDIMQPGGVILGVKFLFGME